MNSGLFGITGLADGRGGNKRRPRHTRRSMADGPPNTPRHGDIWVCTDAAGVGTNTTWEFMYNANATTYKWEFMGGAPAVTALDAAEALANSSAWQALTTMSQTPPRAGIYDYLLTASMFANSTPPVSCFLGLGLNGADPIAPHYTYFNIGNIATSVGQAPTVSNRYTVAASDILRPMFLMNAAAGNSVQHRCFKLWPYRIA